MKTKINYIGVLLLSLMVLTATSCLKDDPLVDWPDRNYLVEIADADHMYAINDQIVGTQVVYDSILVNQCAIHASHITASFDVQLGLNEDLVATYNANNGLDGTVGKEKYILMPVANYTLPASVTIDAGNKKKWFDVTVDTTGLTPGGKYIIPVAIKSVPAPYIASRNFGYINLLLTLRP